MNKTNLIRINRIIGNQYFTLENSEYGIPIRTGESLAGDFFIDKEQSTVKVTVSESALRIDEIKDQFFIDLKLFLDTNLIIKNFAGWHVPVKLSFSKPFSSLAVTECSPSQVSHEILQRLRCQVLLLEANSQFSLHPEAKTFDHELSITLIITVEFEDQIDLAPQKPLIPGEVLTAIEIAAGKIRSQIGKQLFKHELLIEISKVKKLLLSGNITGALALLTAIKEQILVKSYTCTESQIKANLVLGDLVAVEKQVINLL